MIIIIDRNTLSVVPVTSITDKASRIPESDSRMPFQAKAVLHNIEQHLLFSTEM